MSPFLFIFTALNCEARPLIRHWHLQKHPGNHPFGIYASEERAIVVTGIGKIAMAGAVGYTRSAFPAIPSPLLLNLGIAGHPGHGIGSLHLADKIIDAETGKRFYPQLPFSAPCPTGTVATRSRPHTDYAENFLYDMEASAFYEMAVKFSSSELIHCLKIVSDNAQSPLENIRESLVETWCAGQLPTIEEFVTRLQRIRGAAETASMELYESLCGQFHFTTASAVKLKALLRRWRLLMGDEIPDWQGAHPRNGKELIAWLEERLETTEFYL